MMLSFLQWRYQGIVESWKYNKVVLKKEKEKDLYKVKVSCNMGQHPIIRFVPNFVNKRWGHFPYPKSHQQQTNKQQAFEYSSTYRFNHHRLHNLI